MTQQATWKRIRVALVAYVVFLITLLVSLGTLGSHGLPQGGGTWRGPLLKNSYEGYTAV